VTVIGGFNENVFELKKNCRSDGYEKRRRRAHDCVKIDHARRKSVTEAFEFFFVCSQSFWKQPSFALSYSTSRALFHWTHCHSCTKMRRRRRKITWAAEEKQTKRVRAKIFVVDLCCGIRAHSSKVEEQNPLSVERRRRLRFFFKVKFSFRRNPCAFVHYIVSNECYSVVCDKIHSLWWWRIIGGRSQTVGGPWKAFRVWFVKIWRWCLFLWMAYEVNPYNVIIFLIQAIDPEGGTIQNLFRSS